MGFFCEIYYKGGNVVLKQEKEMRETFDVQVQDLLASIDRFQKNGDSLRVGLESEIAIHARSSDSELVQKRDAIIADNSDFTDVELGASQIEIRTPPIDLLSTNGMSSLTGIYKQRFFNVLDSARKHGVGILRIGANPFLPTIKTPRTDKPKYRLVPDFYNRNRDPYLDTMIGLGKNQINIGDAAIVSLFQSFQVNLEANSLADACDKMNRSLVIAPYLLAFSGNARYLKYQDTRIQDVRMIGWAASHDTRTFCDTEFQDLRILSWEKSFDVRPKRTKEWQNELRVGLPSRYFRNIDDYFQRVGSFPFILSAPDSALAISVGMTWLDTRVKFIGDSAIVELRLPSTQPTIDEEIVLMLVYIGRLHYSQMTGEMLLPMTMVQENRLSAMLYGLERPLWFLSKNGSFAKLPAKEGLMVELERAVAGLNHLELSSCLEDEILDTMLNLGSPSSRLATLLNPIDNLSMSNIEYALLELKML